jgi:hypothetical protein
MFLILFPSIVFCVITREVVDLDLFGVVNREVAELDGHPGGRMGDGKVNRERSNSSAMSSGPKKKPSLDCNNLRGFKAVQNWFGCVPRECRYGRTGAWEQLGPNHGRYKPLPDKCYCKILPKTRGVTDKDCYTTEMIEKKATPKQFNNQAEKWWTKSSATLLLMLGGGIMLIGCLMLPYCFHGNSQPRFPDASRSLDI